MTLTQPFGVDYLGNSGPGGKSYADIGLKKGHNGWDLSALGGTEVFAVMDGDVIYTEGGSGYGNDLRIRSKELGLEVVNGHLQDAVVKSGSVKAGDLIAHSDNTGFTTGPHLHLGIRLIHWLSSGAGPIYDNYDNGFFGYVDPTPYFAPDVFALPVDRKYGLPEQARGYTELQWYVVAAWIFRTYHRLPTVREKNALVWGRWDWRTVNDPALWPIWTEQTKMLFNSR